MTMEGNKHELHALKGDVVEKTIDDPIVLDDKRGSLRGNWSGRFEFVLSAVGYTVGLSNIWRFPYLCLRNGGGAFLIPFCFFLCVCGGPLYYLEVCLGQFSGRSPIIVWEICPLFKGIGAVMVFLSVVCMWYFIVVFAWAIYYLIYSFQSTLAWTTCDNWWNTPQCVETSKWLRSNASMNGTLPSTMHLNSSVYDANNNLSTLAFNLTTTSTIHRTAATEFWLYNVLRISNGIDNLGGIQPHLAGVLCAAWFITFLCLAKGIKSLGKVVYVTVIAPYILLTVLLIRGVTLDGAVDGLKLYVTPDFERLKHGQVWIEAAIQVFYSLGPAWGGVITMASFNKFNHNCLRDSVIVCVADFFTAFYSGLVVFSVLGFLAKETGLSIEQLAATGPGLAFIVYPEALSRLPLPQLWSALFFATLILVGIDSQFGVFETITNAVIDVYFYKLHKYKFYISVFTATSMFVMGLPLTTNGGYYIFQLIDWYFAAFSLFFTCFMEVVAVAWIYGADRFSQDIAAMTGSYPSLLTRCVWVIIAPVLMMGMFILALVNYQAPNYGDSGYIFPNHAVVIGNILAVIPVGLLFGVAIWVFLNQEGGIRKRLSRLLNNDHWLPNDKKQKQVYLANPYVYETAIHRRILRNVFGIKH